MINMEMTPESIIFSQLDFVFRGGTKKEKKAVKKGLTEMVRGHRYNNPFMVTNGIQAIENSYQAMRNRLKVDRND